MTKKALYRREVRIGYHSPKLLWGHRVRVSGVVITFIIFRCASREKHLLGSKWTRHWQLRYAIACDNDVLMSGIAKSWWKKS